MRQINLSELKGQFRGKPYSALVQEHVKKSNETKIYMASMGIRGKLPSNITPQLTDFVELWNARAYDSSFWKQDCAEILTEITSQASDILNKSGIEPDDETLFNIFLLITLGFAFSASTQPAMRKFAGIKKGLFL